MHTDTAQRAQDALDDLGPFAPEADLEQLVHELPPSAGVYLAGYLAGIRGLTSHRDHDTLMTLRDYQNGLQAGREIRAAAQR